MGFYNGHGAIFQLRLGVSLIGRFFLANAVWDGGFSELVFTRSLTLGYVVGCEKFG